MTEPKKAKIDEGVPYKEVVARKLKAGEFEIYQPKKKSAKCWEKFGHPKVAGTDTVYSVYAVCLTCKYIYLYDSKKGNSALNSHKCPTDSASGQTRLSGVVVTPKCSKNVLTLLPERTRQNINELAAITSAVDMRPLSVFEGEGMIRFCQELIDTTAQIGRFDFKSTIVNHRNLSRTHLNNVYEKHLTQIKTTFKDLVAMAHTTDAWKDKYTGNCYMSLTCFFIDSEWRWYKIVWKTEKFNVASKNAEVTRNWYMKQVHEIGLDIDRHYVVSDNASVMAAAFRNLNGIGCTPHIINLVVTAMTDGVPEIREMLSAAKRMVMHVKKTDIQTQLPKRLAQSITTRWNSTLIMIESIEAVWVDLSKILIEREEARYLTEISLASIRDIIEFLK